MGQVLLWTILTEIAGLGKRVRRPQHKKCGPVGPRIHLDPLFVVGEPFPCHVKPLVATFVLLTVIVCCIVHVAHLLVSCRNFFYCVRSSRVTPPDSGELSLPYGET